MDGHLKSAAVAVSFICSIIFAVPTASGQIDHQNLVYIECYDNSGRTISRGSGVVVGDLGHVLTAKHVVYQDHWDIKEVSCRGARGLGGVVPSRWLVRSTKSQDYDAALLKMLPEPEERFHGLEYSYASQGDDIEVWGVPFDSPARTFDQIAGTITSAIHDNEGFLNTTPMTTRGMSGGPVVDKSSGALIGIISGAKIDITNSLPTTYKVLSTELFAAELRLSPADPAERFGDLCSREWDELDDLDRNRASVSRQIDIFARFSTKCGAKAELLKSLQNEVYSKIIDEYDAIRNSDVILYDFYDILDDLGVVETRHIYEHYASRLCAGGDADSCLFSGAAHLEGFNWWVGSNQEPLELDVGFTLDLAKATLYFEKACELSSLLGCAIAGSVAYKSDFDQGTLSESKAMELLMFSCKRGSIKNGCVNLGLAIMMDFVTVSDPLLREKAMTAASEHTL